MNAEIDNHKSAKLFIELKTCLKGTLIYWILNEIDMWNFLGISALF